jgi:hypothetical protein
LNEKNMLAGQVLNLMRDVAEVSCIFSRRVIH